MRKFRFFLRLAIIAMAMALTQEIRKGGEIAKEDFAAAVAVTPRAIVSEIKEIPSDIYDKYDEILDSTCIRTSAKKREVLDCSDIQIPEYSGEAVVELNDNKPFFDYNQFNLADFEEYSRLDELGRCGQAYAKITKATMPTEARGEIGHIKPTGWHTAKYDKSIIEDMYLYNRCHLIAFCLAGENDNPNNLVTGTRYMNLNMLPYEMAVKEYIDNNPEAKVLYRVTPVFKGDNLVCDGVIIEAATCAGYDINFCVFVYNVQPGIGIDYATGDNWAI